MNRMKRILASALAALMAIGAVGCHQKDETAVTIKNVKFTSAYYMCALIYADTEARSKVQEETSSSSSSSSSSSTSTSSSSTSSIDYYKHKIDKTDYVTWVKKEALTNLKKIAAYKIKCDEAKLTLEKDIVTNAKQYASYYWSTYGYSKTFEPNGVGQDTFTKYMTDSYYSNLYFEHLYGKGGSKEISEDKVLAKTLENFVLVDKLEVSFSSKSADDQATLTAQFNNYVTALNNGTKTFADVYKDYNGSDISDPAEDSISSSVKPADKYASVLGASGTSYSSDYYDQAKAMATGEVKLITEDSSAGLMLLVKRDLSADQYYIDSVDVSARHLIADDEYTKDMETYAASLKAKTVKYAINQFKVKKITYPESSSAS